MKQRSISRYLIIIAALASLMVASQAVAAEPLVIGVPTSLGFLEGKESHKAVQMAVSEINSKGGVNVGGQKRLLEVSSMDIRDAAPGVPVPEALLGIEKNILEKKPVGIVVGPFRSEALVAGMDLIAKYKTPLIGSIAMTPASEAKVKEDPEKYKYIFRDTLNAVHLVKYLAGTMEAINKEFGFTKVYIMHQDVAWARATADGVKKAILKKPGGKSWIKKPTRPAPLTSLPL